MAMTKTMSDRRLVGFSSLRKASSEAAQAPGAKFSSISLSRLFEKRCSCGLAINLSFKAVKENSYSLIASSSCWPSRPSTFESTLSFRFSLLITLLGSTLPREVLRVVRLGSCRGFQTDVETPSPRPSRENGLVNSSILRCNGCKACFGCENSFVRC